jgi:hypothetical protein
MCYRLPAQVVPTSNIVRIFHVPSTSRTGRSHIKHSPNFSLPLTSRTGRSDIKHGPNFSFAIELPHRSVPHQTWSEFVICHRLPTQVVPSSNMVEIFPLPSISRTGRSHIKHIPNYSFAIDFPHRSFPHQTWSECFICHRLLAQVVPTSNIVRMFHCH